LPSVAARNARLSQGAAVAIWYGVDHIITNSDGTTAEHYFYRYRQEPDASWGAHAAGRP
jgi:hypothetical protein